MNNKPSRVKAKNNSINLPSPLIRNHMFGNQSDNELRENLRDLVSRREKIDELEYHPMILRKSAQNYDNEEERVKFEIYTGDPNGKPEPEIDFEELENDGLISSQVNQTKVMVCITMYNETYLQVLQSLAGIYRAYYEMVGVDQENEGKFSIVVICDGYNSFHNIQTKGENPSFAESIKTAGLYDELLAHKYVSRPSMWRNLIYKQTVK